MWPPEQQGVVEGFMDVCVCGCADQKRLCPHYAGLDGDGKVQPHAGLVSIVFWYVAANVIHFVMLFNSMLNWERASH